MKSIFKLKIVFLLILFYSGSLFSHGTIIFTNIEHNEGYIDVKIYDSKDTFLNELKKAQKLGYLRQGIAPEEVSKLYISIINRTFQPEFFIQEDVSMKDTINLYIKIMSAGIFNDIALNKIDEMVK